MPAVIKKILADVNGDSDLMRQRLEQWFDDSMQRVSGWYKRRTQAWLFCIGIVVAFLLNADTLTIVRQLQHDPSVREALVKQADAIVANANGLPLDSVQARIKVSVDSLTQAGHALRAAPSIFRLDARRRGVGRLRLGRRQHSRPSPHRDRPLARRALLVRPAQQGHKRAAVRVASAAAAGVPALTGADGYDTAADRVRGRNVEHARRAERRRRHADKRLQDERGARRGERG